MSGLDHAQPPSQKKPFTIVLAGNPNCGKTALFNALTGSRQRVGNWSGVTVERKTGFYVDEGEVVEVVDLPGVYSTSVLCEKTAIDEQIACEYLLSADADIIVNVIDASNLERNLYLTLQLLEKGIPVIIVMNMMDLVERRGITVDSQQLSEALGCSVLEMVAHRKKGLSALKEMIRGFRHHRPQVASFSIPLPDALSSALESIRQKMLSSEQGFTQSTAHWLALRLLEGDCFATKQVSTAMQECVSEKINELEQVLTEESDIIIADARYRFIHDIAKRVTSFKQTKQKNLTEWVDRIVLNRFLGIPIFLLMMYLLFVFSINVGGAFQDFFDLGSAAIFIDGSARILSALHAPSWLIGLISQGVGVGLNTVLTFVPVLGGLFLFLSLLEDSGYMARAAFVMDRFMQTVGLPGKAFVPMIVGFGCNVPAVMGARTLENPRDRVLTVMMMPFMSCGARLAIFSVFASAFFPKGGAFIIFLLYLTGIFAAVLTGFLLRKTILFGKAAPLVMELPSYHVPQIKTLLRQSWQRLKGFLFRAGKVIVPVCVIIGCLNTVSLKGEWGTSANTDSVLSAVGRVLTPVFSPIGIHQDNWEATVGLATGVLAKEVVIGTLNTLYSEINQYPAEQSLNVWKDLKVAAYSIPQNISGLSEAFKNPLLASESAYQMDQTAYGVMVHEFDGKAGAFAYLLFILLYFPCISTMAVMRREVGRHWTYFSVAWSMGMAYALSVLVYQGLTVFQHPLASASWFVGVLIILGITVWALRRYGKSLAARGI